ncbi:hypothetical protein HanIR_Chr02g0092011 [Helianthus annuus]|nr:hypothetical protein HanIR_Chr02g0092011 [Helianthus annuus]
MMNLRVRLVSGKWSMWENLYISSLYGPYMMSSTCFCTNKGLHLSPLEVVCSCSIHSKASAHPMWFVQQRHFLQSHREEMYTARSSCRL